MEINKFQLYLNKAKEILTDPVKLQSFVRNNKKELLYWVIFIVAIIIVFFVFSDGDFSFFLTLSGLVQMFGFFLIAMSVQKTQNVTGLSLHTLICYSVSFFARLCSVLFYEGYLPYDSSGDYIYRVGELSAFILAVTMVVFVAIKYKTTYNWDLDAIHSGLLIAPTLVAACLIHPSLNDSYFGDISWTFALYLESVAMFPQIYMITKKGGEVEAFTSHFVTSQGISRILAIIFWILSFHELNIYDTTWSLFSGYTGYFVLLSQLLQVGLLSDFMYHYFKSMSTGLPMNIDRYNV